MLFGQQHEPLVQELDVLLGPPRIPVTASGAVMTLPASTADLRDWIADDREFRSGQRDDWMQVIGDFSASLEESGPKLLEVVTAIATSITPLLQNLIRTTPAPPGGTTPTYTVDAALRADLLQRLKRLDAALATDEAIVAAWCDLVASCTNSRAKVEKVSFRRDTLWALAERRDLELGSFGVFHEVSAVLTDSAYAVQEEIDPAGVDDEYISQPPWQPSGVPTWQRLDLCARILARPPERGDCIIWLRLSAANLPQYEVTHGQVTFYNAAYLSAFVKHPIPTAELPKHFKASPSEILGRDTLDEGVEWWEDDSNMVYARVLLPDTVVQTAAAKARALVEALKAVNHATKNSWRILNGFIVFVDGDCSLIQRGPKEDIPDPYEPRNDSMGRDVGLMAGSNQALDSESMHELQDAIGMSTALKKAGDDSPQATVIAAVRAIEHVNTWTTGGGTGHWADFVATYFKRAYSCGRVVADIHKYARAAIDHVPGPGPQPDLANLRSTLLVFDWPHERFHTRGAADHMSTLAKIYADHWLSRGVGELATVLGTKQAMYGRLEEHGQRFDRQLGRLKRLRNSAIHGGPLSDAACRSVETFAFNLGHRCLNEAMRALLTRHDIPSHITGYREDYIDRYERVRTAGDVDALFVRP
jgi:hypothetical protein